MNNESKDQGQKNTNSSQNEEWNNFASNLEKHGLAARGPNWKEDYLIRARKGQLYYEEQAQPSFRHTPGGEGYREEMKKRANEFAEAIDQINKQQIPTSTYVNTYCAMAREEEHYMGIISGGRISPGLPRIYNVNAKEVENRISKLGKDKPYYEHLEAGYEKTDAKAPFIRPIGEGFVTRDLKPTEPYDEQHDGGYHRVDPNAPYLVQREAGYELVDPNAPTRTEHDGGFSIDYPKKTRTMYHDGGSTEVPKGPRSLPHDGAP